MIPTAIITLGMKSCPRKGRKKIFSRGMPARPITSVEIARASRKWRPRTMAEIIRPVSAEHIDLAVRHLDYARHAEHERQTQGDQDVDTGRHQSVENDLRTRGPSPSRVASVR